MSGRRCLGRRRQRLVHDLRFSPTTSASFPQLQHRELDRDPQVHRPDDFGLRHETHESLDQIVDVAERSRLRAIA
jgi:hypothetical protein